MSAHLTADAIFKKFITETSFHSLIDESEILSHNFPFTYWENVKINIFRSERPEISETWLIEFC